MSSPIFYKFGKKKFTRFLVAEAIGLCLIGLHFLPNNHKIYLVVVITALVSMGYGIQSLIQSFKTPHCSKCQQEFSEKTVSYQREDKEKLVEAVRDGKSQLLTSLELTRGDGKNRCETILEYCPTCKEIGLVKVTTIDNGKKTKIVENQIIQGEFVKALDESMID
jgi:hypothetical protein